MSRETTDTNNTFNDNIPDGTYDFEINKVVRKELNGKVGYEWKLDYQIDGSDYTGKVLTWPNQIGPLLSVLGCKETDKKGVYDWDTDLMEGKTFRATITHDEDKKKPGKVYQNMRDFAPSSKKEEAPF